MIQSIRAGGRIHFCQPFTDLSWASGSGYNFSTKIIFQESNSKFSASFLSRPLHRLQSWCPIKPSISETTTLFSRLLGVANKLLHDFWQEIALRFGTRHWTITHLLCEIQRVSFHRLQRHSTLLICPLRVSTNRVQVLLLGHVCDSVVAILEHTVLPVVRCRELVTIDLYIVLQNQPDAQPESH